MGGGVQALDARLSGVSEADALQCGTETAGLEITAGGVLMRSPMTAAILGDRASVLRMLSPPAGTPTTVSGSDDDVGPSVHGNVVSTKIVLIRLVDSYYDYHQAARSLADTADFPLGCDDVCPHSFSDSTTPNRGPLDFPCGGNASSSGGCERNKTTTGTASAPSAVTNEPATSDTAAPGTQNDRTAPEADLSSLYLTAVGGTVQFRRYGRLGLSTSDSGPSSQLWQVIEMNGGVLLRGVTPHSDVNQSNSFLTSVGFLEHGGVAFRRTSPNGDQFRVDSGRFTVIDRSITLAGAMSSSGYRWKWQCAHDASPCAGLTEGDSCNSCRFDPDRADAALLFDRVGAAEQLRNVCAERRRSQSDASAFEVCTASRNSSSTMICTAKPGSCSAHCHCSDAEYCSAAGVCHPWNVTSFSKAVAVPRSAPFEGLANREDDLYVGPVLAWRNVTEAEKCKDECLAEALCTGFSFFGNATSRSSANRCMLWAGVADDEATWQSTGRRRRRDMSASDGATLQFKRPLASEQYGVPSADCVCKRFTNESVTFPPPPPPLTKTEEITTELGGDIKPGETRVLIHGRLEIYGLSRSILVDLSPSSALLYTGGSLFGTFLKAEFGIEVALKPPRRFRVFGMLVAESKEETIRRVKLMLNDLGQAAVAAVETAQAVFVEVKDRLLQGVRVVQEKLDKVRAKFDKAKQALTKKQDELDRKDRELKKSLRNPPCEMRKCSKKKWWKRPKCWAKNAWCGLRRAAWWLKIQIKRAVVAIKKVGVEIAKQMLTVAEGAVYVLERALDGVKYAAEIGVMVAQKALDVAKAAVQFGTFLAQKAFEGLLRTIFLKRFEFDFELSLDSSRIMVAIEFVSRAHILLFRPLLVA